MKRLYALLAALLPYLHLTALAFVGAVAAVSPGVAWMRRRRAAELAPPLLGFGLAAVLTALLYWPVIDALRAYLAGIDELPSPGAVSALDITTLLAGGRSAGLVWLGAVPLASLWILRVRGASAAWQLAAIAGPLVGLPVSTPYGMGYAYARYLLMSLPFVLMLLAWLFVQLVEALVPRAGVAGRVAGVVGVGALLGLYLTGPAAPTRADDHPFSNSYLALRESGADYLVLHVAVDAELARYWRFVYDEAWPAVRMQGDEGLMLRHEDYTSQEFPRLHGLVGPLTERLGEPVYRDALIVLWRL